MKLKAVDIKQRKEALINEILSNDVKYYVVKTKEEIFISKPFLGMNNEIYFYSYKWSLRVCLDNIVKLEIIEE